MIRGAAADRYPELDFGPVSFRILRRVGIQELAQTLRTRLESGVGASH